MVVKKLGNKKSKIEMRDISMEFPGVKALSNVDFNIETGKIHALIGANGAGKSTLMKVLSGAYDGYTGKIYIDEEFCNIRSPKEAKVKGIEIVYQEVDTALIPYLTVAENIMLNSLVNKMQGKQWINWQVINASAKKVLERLGVEINVKTIVEDLTLAQKQMVLIARAISEDCKFLILDEPTAPLSNTETEELFRVVRELAQNNVGIIFISHRLPELFEICEEITIMKDGQIVTTKKIQEVTVNDIVELMLGRQYDESFVKYPVELGETLFEVKNLTDQDFLIEDINMYVRKGEIVGISGLVGAGKTELCKTIFGALPVRQGEVLLQGQPINIKSPYRAVRNGLALVPEERRKEGVLVFEPVYSNLSAASLSNFTNILSFIKKRAERCAAKKMITELGIKTPSEGQKVAYLSGGNQQKVAVGKWLLADAEVYIFDEPTKGVDVGAKQDIFELIGRLVQMGKGVIYASCEVAEILGISDRTYVMYDGKIVKELETSQTSEQEILYYSTGGQ